MKAISLFLAALLATITLAKFVPVPAFNLSQLQGEWNVLSVYDTNGNDWTNTQCFTFNFDILNSSVVNMTFQAYDPFYSRLDTEELLLYPDAENPAILYQGPNNINSPLLILNVSSVPYWVNNKTDTIIFGFNYSHVSNNTLLEKFVIFGASRAYDITYDITPFLDNYYNSIPQINYTSNYWFINSACDTHFGWTPLKTFKAQSLLKASYNLIGVYDPAGSGLVPWYTGSAVFDWEQAYCAQVSFTNKTYSTTANYFEMSLTLRSLFQGEFQRTWDIIPAPELNAALMGFNIDSATLLYVQYADAFGNLILTAGTTTSFFLSTGATSLTPAYREAFEASLEIMGWKYDSNLIYSIDSSTC